MTSPSNNPKVVPEYYERVLTGSEILGMLDWGEGEGANATEQPLCLSFCGVFGRYDDPSQFTVKLRTRDATWKYSGMIFPQGVRYIILRTMSGPLIAAACNVYGDCSEQESCPLWRTDCFEQLR
jgi:hypothetical protein